MKFRTEAGKGGLVNFINLGIRALQFLVGLAILILYATQPSYLEWYQSGQSLKFALGTAAGALAVATTPFLGLLPFFIGYAVVAWAFVWDFIVMVIYAATFAYFKNRFPWGHEGKLNEDRVVRLTDISRGRMRAMEAAVILDLIAMLLWVITLLMSVGLLVFGRFRGSSVNKY